MYGVMHFFKLLEISTTLEWQLFRAYGIIWVNKVICQYFKDASTNNDWRNHLNYILGGKIAMLQKITKILKKAIGLVIVFSIIWIFAYLFVFGMFRALAEFKIINSNMRILVYAITTVTAGLIVFWTFMSKKTTKFDNWISLHRAQLLFLYIVAVILFGSLNAEVVWTIDELKDLVSLEWSMLGISVAIFLVWNVVILKYLKDRQPEERVTGGWLDKCRFITEKGEFYQTASMLFSSTTLLTINVAVVIIATAMVYILRIEVTLWMQNATIVGFLFCTNTLGSLFGDMLKPFNEEKKAMLQATKVTDADIELQNKLLKQMDEYLILTTAIDQLESIDKDEKLKIKEEFINKILGENPKNPTA